MLPSLLRIERFSGSIVIKTHCTPDAVVRTLIRLGIAKATYCYRDPRDVALSLLDHASRSRQAGEKAFSDVVTFTEAVDRASSYLTAMQRWEQFGRALFIRYEDVVANPLPIVERMNAHLSLALEEATLRVIGKQHTRTTRDTRNFNKGVSCRWRSELDAVQIDYVNRRFGGWLRDHGYELS